MNQDPALRGTAIVLDPGHGGDRNLGGSSSSGGRGPGGIFEKDVTLALAKRVALHLGPGVLVTRDRDENVSLSQRSALAARSAARVFVSLHTNRGAPGMRGCEAYVHARSSHASHALARSLQGALARLGNPTSGVRAAELAVLTPDRLAPQTAACLLEVDYLSSPEGERALSEPVHVDKTAQAIAHGIRRYLGSAALEDPEAAATQPLPPDEGDGEPFDADTPSYGGLIRRFAINSFKSHTQWRSFRAPGGRIRVTAEARWDGTQPCNDGGNQYKVEFSDGSWVWMPIGEWRTPTDPAADTCDPPVFKSGTQTVNLSAGTHRMRLVLDPAWTDSGGVQVRGGRLES
jgi:N-acetylmuramoyl-L-alanine amidase